MLIPLSRKKFEELVPLVATGAQYAYYWGKFPDFLRRILVSIAALASILLIRSLFPIEEFRSFSFFIGLFALVYWLWRPVLQASLRNFSCRRYKFAGFFRGEVLDIYVTEEVVGTQENVNDRGELVVTENRERRLNLEVGDDSGFVTRLQVPIKPEHRAIIRGDVAEMVVMSNRPDLSRISRTTDIFIARPGIWVSDYPYLRRDEFEAVSRRLDARSDYESGYEDEADYEEDRAPRNVRSGSQRDFSKSPRDNRRFNSEVVETSAAFEEPSSALRRRSEIENEFEEEYEHRPRKRIPRTGANGFDRQFPQPRSATKRRRKSYDDF